jgi:hypothetical protein
VVRTTVYPGVNVQVLAAGHRRGLWPNHTRTYSRTTRNRIATTLEARCIPPAEAPARRRRSTQEPAYEDIPHFFRRMHGVGAGARVPCRFRLQHPGRREFRREQYDYERQQ